MKILRFFESNQQSREIDLQELWNDFNHYRNELNVHIVMVESFKSLFLDPILKNNKIDFQRAVHPYDDEVTYNHSGIVSEVDIDKQLSYFQIIVELVGDFEKPIGVDFSNVPNRWVVVKIYKDPNIKNTYNNRIIRVYGDITENEEKINMLKNSEKYNL